MDAATDQTGLVFIGSLVRTASGHASGDGALAVALRSAREVAVALRTAERVDTEGAARLVEAAKALWAEWHKQFKSDKVLKLPPLYPGEDTTTLLRTELSRVCLSPLSEKEGNTILHGALGVGKTTMLRALCILHVLLFPADVVCFWDYEAAVDRGGALDDVYPPAARLLQSVRKWKNGDASLPLQLVPWKLGDEVSFDTRHPEEAPAVYVDEINRLYFEQGNPRVGHGMFASGQLRLIGKTDSCRCIATGSARRLRDMVFREDDSKEGDKWKDYESLNDSVFKIIDVLPLREAATVQDYLKHRYNVDVDVDRARAIFIETGGVGRHIHDLSKACDLAGSELPDLHHRGTQEAKKLLDTGSNAFWSFCALLVVASGGDADGGEAKTPDVPAVPYALITAPAHAAGFSKQDLLSWVDSSILIEGDDAWELLVPSTMQAISDILTADMMSRQALALMVTIRGWGDYGSAGAALEPLVINYCAGDKLRDEKFTIVDGKLCSGDARARVADLSRASCSYRRIRAWTAYGSPLQQWVTLPGKCG